ncbi:MAG: hypothetical protein Ct9H300mP21_05860 [Pseudomonadota bacterium]|nr:MAG: hypothetical protein Ct9H300mP21_05860 [Pseudomonadota bacterium]
MIPEKKLRRRGPGKNQLVKPKNGSSSGYVGGTQEPSEKY